MANNATNAFLSDRVYAHFRLKVFNSLSLLSDKSTENKLNLL